ncbi:hypothetical protein ACFOKE_06290 [Enterococcus rivorum]|uniref:hypothetical protein n=1 Tax=Enterococcus rivorum TaxID=762845 RepID=UPI00361CD53F
MIDIISLIRDRENAGVVKKESDPLLKKIIDNSPEEFPIVFFQNQLSEKKIRN